MKFEVEMLAFEDGKIRNVEVPQDEIKTLKLSDFDGTTSGLLDAIFLYGQNDFQPQPICSVSVGDVVRLGNKRFSVDAFGFSEVTGVPSLQ
jgi:hypothetical protein